MLTQENYDDINKSLVGFDIDVTMVRLGLMNLMMHGIEDPHIDYSDSLSKKHTEPDGTYDVVMANPPFSGNIDSQDKSEDLNIQTTKSELLFLSKIYNMLSNGGTAGVIVPSGVLFGASNAYVATREKLIKSCELKAVINMPSGVFKPYAGVSTAILIFIKGGITKNVWFYDMKSDGYSLDDKKVKLESSDLKDIVNRFNSLKTEKNRTHFDQSFLVPAEEIAATGNYDLSLNKYKKVEQEQIIYDNPQKTIADIIAQQEEYTKALLELQKMIEDAVK
ncbi:MAG: N-6 DNA methylase [Candidatus Cloacimonetes bacterium]|nr:N-6 DNA methylase [Candidatus Cloacimonadota bacterium]